MAPTDTFPLIDRTIDGGLEAFLTAARDNGESLRVIAHRLDQEHDVIVSKETVRGWCERLGISTERAS